MITKPSPIIFLTKPVAGPNPCMWKTKRSIPSAFKTPKRILMREGSTPTIILSPSEWCRMILGFCVVGSPFLSNHQPDSNQPNIYYSTILNPKAWPMIKALLGNAPQRMFGHVEEKRAYWRNVSLMLIRTGGYCFSIRHLQYFMPNVRNTCRIWGWMNGTSVTSEEVNLLPNSEEAISDGRERNAWIHWIGPTPPHVGIVSGSDRMMETKVLLHIHGGGFVLPMSNGCIHMARSLLGEVNSRGHGTLVYLALAEYTISPYAEYPTQIRQCIAIIEFLHSQYGIESSNLVISGDSCGGSICLSIVSHMLHPSPSLPRLSYAKNITAPFAGVLLMSPWTSFSTTAPSYTSNAALDTLPPNVIRRFRDTCMPGSSLLPSAPEVVAYRHIDPMKIASLSGKQYEATPDPPIKGLNYGVGVIRPIGSFISGDDDKWWDGIGNVVKKMIITAGERECFRDDIVGFARNLQKATDNQYIEVKGSVTGGSVKNSQMEFELVMDDSFHAVLLSDFAFGVPPGALAVKLSGWLAKAFEG